MADIVCDGKLNALHILMLPVNGPAPEYGVKTLEQAKIKLENYIHYKTELNLSREEEIALLYNPDVLKYANLMFCLENAS